MPKTQPLSPHLARADEELLTEPILTQIIERVLGFPVDAYLPQLGKSGLKPDFTPMDLVAHPFVLDAKSSDQRDLRQHEKQIRSYVDQRGLTQGILFNLRELKVFRRGAAGYDPALSFSVLPLWEYAHGRQMAGPEVATFERFAYHDVTLDDQIATIREQTSWASRPGSSTLEVDVDYLVERLRRLAESLTGRTRRTAPDQLTVSRGRAVLASVSGPPHRLDLLEATANGDAPIGSTLLPSDMAQFDARCSAVAAEVNGLLADGRRLVEEVERLVCALYAVPAELTERVIEHAVRRAADPLAQTTQDE